MNKQFDLRAMGVESISSNELMSIDGGKFWDWVIGVGVAVILVGLSIGSLGLALAGAGAAGLGAYENLN